MSPEADRLRVYQNLRVASSHRPGVAFACSILALRFPNGFPIRNVRTTSTFGATRRKERVASQRNRHGLLDASARCGRRRLTQDTGANVRYGEPDRPSNRARPAEQGPTACTGHRGAKLIKAIASHRHARRMQPTGQQVALPPMHFHPSYQFG